MTKLPPVSIPKAQNKTGKSTRAVFERFINAHPSLNTYSQAIWQNATNQGIDPVFYASLIQQESGGKWNPNGSLNDNGSRDYGIAQINSVHFGSPDPFNPGQVITKEKALNPAWALRYSTLLFSNALRKTGSYDEAYSGKGGYNYGGSTPKLPKGYVIAGVASTGAVSPTTAAQRSVAVSTAKKAITTDYVIVTKKGTIKYTQNPNANGVVKSGGLPVTRSDFTNAWMGSGGYNEMYQSYTGKNATPKQVKQLIESGLGEYAITKLLVSGKNFVNSPVWKKTSVDYEAGAQQIYGNKWLAKDHADLIRKAVSNNVSVTGFQDMLRRDPKYTTSSEYKNSFSSLNNVYQTIYGKPDDTSNQSTKSAVLNGWSTDQYASYLRSQPAYTSSDEYHTNVASFASQLGLIGGVVPSLPAGTNPLGDWKVKK